jgi:AraC family transcriptional regulator
MNPVNTALWYIESHFASELTLGEIARHAGVSGFYLTRAFATVYGRSLMRYVRGRRLTVAARALANGATDILAVALDAGYGSHEAFTRAFRDRFGVTPEAVRACGQLDRIELVEAIAMDQRLLDDLEPPRIVTHPSFLVAGLAERYGCDESAGVPSQWQRFVPSLGSVPGQVGRAAYGVNYNGDDDGNFDYLCGVEVSSFAGLARSWGRLRIPEQRYAVFAHRDHVSTIRRTHNTIWTKWLPQSGYEVADAPHFERYGDDFDGQTGTGGIEVWLPLGR